MPSIATPLRFVVLYHDGVAEPHFDVMFEISAGGELATWRSLYWPAGEMDQVQRIANHRREYLHYEGSISGNRGQVRRIAEGTYRRRETAERWIVEFIDPPLPAVQLPARLA